MIGNNLHEIRQDDLILREELNNASLMEEDVKTAADAAHKNAGPAPGGIPSSWARNDSETSQCETSRKPKISQRLTHFVDFFERRSSSGVLECFSEEQPRIVVSRSRRKTQRTDRYPTEEQPRLPPENFSPTDAESMTHKKSLKRDSSKKPSSPAATAPVQKGNKVLQIIRRYFNNQNSSDADEAASLSPSSSSVISSCRRPCWDPQKNRGERSMTISSGTTGGGKTQWVEVEKQTPFTVGRSISKVWKKQVVNVAADDDLAEAGSEKAEQRQQVDLRYTAESRHPNWSVTNARDTRFAASLLMHDMIETRPTILVGADSGPVSKIVNEDWKKRDELASQLESPPLASPWLTKSHIERQETLLMNEHMNADVDATGLSGPGSSSGSNFIWDQFRVSQSSSSLLEHQAQLEDSFSLGQLPYRRHSSDLNSNEKEGRLTHKEKIKRTGSHPKFIFSMDSSEPLVARDDVALLCRLRSPDMPNQAVPSEEATEAEEERVATPAIVRKVSEPFSYRARTQEERCAEAPRARRLESSEEENEGVVLSAGKSSSPPASAPEATFFEESARQQENQFAPSEPGLVQSHGLPPSPDSKVKKASHFVAIRIEDADVIEKTRIFQELLIKAYPLLEECRAKPQKLHLTLLVLSLAPEDVSLATEALQIGMKRFMKVRGDLVEANQARLLAEGKIRGIIERAVAKDGAADVGDPTKCAEAATNWAEGPTKRAWKASGTRSFNQAPSPEACPPTKSGGGFTLEFRTIGTFGLDLLFLAPSVGQSIILKCLHVELAKAFSELGLVIVGAGSGWNSAVEIHHQLIGKGFIEEDPSVVRTADSPKRLRGSRHTTPVLSSTGQRAAWTVERQEDATATVDPVEDTTGEDTPPMWPAHLGGARFHGRSLDRNRKHKNGFVWPHQKKLSLLDEALLKVYDHSANKSTTFVPQITLFKVSRANKKAKKRKGVHAKDASPACDPAPCSPPAHQESPNGRKKKVLKLIPRMYHPLVQRTLICGLDETTTFSPHSYLEFLPPPPPPQFAGRLESPPKMNDSLPGEQQAGPTPTSEFLMVPLDQIVTTSRLHSSPFGMQTCFRVDLLEMSQLDPDEYYKRVCSVVLNEDASALFN